MHEFLEHDAPRLRRAVLVRFETWMAADDPEAYFEALVSALLDDDDGRRRLHYHGSEDDIKIVPTPLDWPLETDQARLARFEPQVNHFGYSLTSYSLLPLPAVFRAIELHSSSPRGASPQSRATAS